MLNITIMQQLIKVYVDIKHMYYHIMKVYTYISIHLILGNINVTRLEKYSLHDIFTILDCL